VQELSPGLAGRRILLGVTGGIAAYKAAEVIRKLRGAGAEVRVAMTRSATAFITPLTLQALSGYAVHGQLLDPASEAAMGHIELGRWPDLFLIAPATADFIARLAQGRADDLLAASCLVSRAPLVLAPAMNQHMWDHPATQANVRLLMTRGVDVWGPDTGTQACGDVGPGRLLEPAELARRVIQRLERGPLSGVRVLVTAGPTREALDPVRFIGNRSSGKMGYAVAAAARDAGAEVTLVSGPVALSPPAGIECLAVETAAEMYAAVMARVGAADVLIATAAVADYRPTAVSPQKIKKSAAQLSLQLERTADILGTVAALPAGPFTVGFAAETSEPERHAREKLERKGLDLVCANRVGVPGLGFESEHNALSVLWKGGHAALARAPKPALARELIALIAERYDARQRTA